MRGGLMLFVGNKTVRFMPKIKKFGDRLYAWHDKYHRLKLRVKQALPRQNQLKNSWAYRIFGATLLRHDYWCFKGQPLVRGLALGMFVAFTPTIHDLIHLQDPHTGHRFLPQCRYGDLADG